VVNVCFYRGLSEKKPKEVYMFDLHREKHTYVYKRRLYKTREDGTLEVGPT
jgi:hypothetical protein